MSNIPEDLKFYKEHEWVRKLEDGSVLIGITDYAQNNLTDITYVGFKVEKGSNVEFEKVFGEIESVKSVSDLFSPISGEILEKNDSLEDEPEHINNDPYGDGWMLKIKPSKFDEEISQLMDAASYKSFIETL